MNRFDRVTAILIQLQSKKIVRAKDISSRFNVSLRTIYRDIRTLEEAGVPIASEAGIGYSLMEGYRLPPIMFSKEEVTAFLTAEKLMEKFTDNSIDSSFKSGMLKIRAILKSSDKELLENIEGNIEVLRRKPLVHNSNDSNLLQTIIQSIPEKKALQIRYHTFYSNEIKDRIIEPIGVFFSENYWHTIAYCELRNDYRDFRLDRILNIIKTDNDFKKIHPAIKDYMQKFKRDQNLETVIIDIDSQYAHYLKEQKYYYGFVDEKQINDKIQMTFLTAYLKSFAQWFIMFADKADIISPIILKDILKEVIDKIKSRNFQ
jgi:predicted DNA-binding transcriptional regulator YafY